MPICRQLYILSIIARSYEATLSAMGILGDPEPGRPWVRCSREVAVGKLGLPLTKLSRGAM